VAKVCLVGHIFACLWQGLAFYYTVKEKTWVHSKNLEFESNFTKYLFAFYWTTTTMCTVGYGGIKIVEFI
jgi:hypothetical protein